MTEPAELLSELAVLARSLSPLIAPPGNQELLRSLTETARALFGAGACSLALLSDNEDELVYVAASGEGSEQVVGMRIGAGEGIAGWVMQSGQPAAVSDLARDGRFSRTTAEETGYVPNAILAVPVTSPRGQIGVLTLLDRDSTRDGAQFDLRTASLFADQAALAIESARTSTDLCRMLLAGLTEAAESGSTLADALDGASTVTASSELIEITSLLARLAARSPADRELAVRLLQVVVTDPAGRRASR